MRESRDERGNQERVRALFLFGAVLPSLWAIWVVFAVAVSNSPFYGSPPEDRRYPREVPDLWVTAVILTFTAAALITLGRRSATRRVVTTVFTTLALVAAAANWAILLFL